MKGMGEVRTRVKLENEGDRTLFKAGNIGREAVRSQEIDAIVDTGAVLTLLPQDLVEFLGLEPIERTIVTLADERRVEMTKVGTLSLTILGRNMKMDCLAGPPGCEALIGQTVLEELDLIVDPARRTLRTRPESPDMPNLKMKTACQGA